MIGNPLLGRNPEEFLKAGKLEDPDGYKATPEFKSWLDAFSVQCNKSRSEFMREAICMWATLLEIEPDLKSLTVQRIRDRKDYVGKILVLLKEI